MSKSPRVSLNSSTQSQSTPSGGRPRPSNSNNSSPNPRRATTSSTSSISTSNSTPVVRGPTAVDGLYHKRIRSYLIEHAKLRKEWDQLVLRGLVGRCRAIIECWVEVENGIKMIDKTGSDKNSKGKEEETEESAAEHRRNIRAGYLYSQSVKLSEGLGLIAVVLGALDDILSTMNSVVERAEGLVIEAAKTRGTAFAFREPLWVTWPLSRFADGLADLTAFYSPSLLHIRSLIDTLTTFPILPSSYPILISPLDPLPSSISPVITTEVLTKKEKERVRPKPEELQACMSLLAVQPLLPPKLSTSSSEAWEELCCIEVGNWSA